MKGVCPQSNEACPYFAGGCFESVHHEYWPRNEYSTPVERIFRDLPENKVMLCRDLHDELHAEQDRSEKPSREEMMEAIGQSAVYLSVNKQRKLYGAA